MITYLNTAIRRLMSKMLATSRYIDIMAGVIQRPGWHGGSPTSPQSAEMKMK
jgi:hypothetical protein